METLPRKNSIYQPIPSPGDWDIGIRIHILSQDQGPFFHHAILSYLLDS